MLKSLIVLSVGLVLGFVLCVMFLSFAHQGSVNPVHAWQHAHKVVGLLLSGEPTQAVLSEHSSVRIAASAPLIALDAAAIEEIEGIHLQGSPLLKPGAKVAPPSAQEVAIVEQLEKLEEAERAAQSAAPRRADGDH